MSSSPTLQVCRSCGGGAPVDVHFCPQCSKILTLGRHGDYFSFLGLQRKLRISPGNLEQRFRALSRQFHPDYYYNSTPAERRASLERSSYLNDAYRTLRDPVRRVEYLLGLEGMAPRGPEEASTQVPKTLLEQVFALNEELDEIRALRQAQGAPSDQSRGEMKAGGAPPDAWKGRLERAREPIEAKRAEHERQLDELSQAWDAAVDGGSPDAEKRKILEALRERILERNYINNLLSGIERELAGETSA